MSTFTAEWLRLASMISLFAERALSAPWAVSVSKARDHGLLQVTAAAAAGRSEPDIIAYSRHPSWHVIEAKGRLLGTNAVVDGAKVQAGAVALINGSKPDTNVACVTFLKDFLTACVRDPA